MNSRKLLLRFAILFNGSMAVALANEASEVRAHMIRNEVNATPIATRLKLCLRDRLRLGRSG